MLIEFGHIDKVRQLAADGDGYCVLVLAEQLAEDGETDRALDMMAPLAADGLAGAVRAVGCLLAECGRIDEAIATLQQFPDADRRSVSGFVARLLARHGRGDEAFAMVCSPVSGKVNGALLVEISAGLGRDEEVIEALGGYPDPSVKVCDCGRQCGTWPAVGQLAEVLERQGKIDAAISLLQGNVRPHNSTSVNAVQQLADMLARHGRNDELHDLINGRGKEYAAHQFALHLESVGDVEAAIGLLAPMAASGSRNPSSYLAGVLMRAERTDEAIDVLRRALPDDPECLLQPWRDLMVERDRAEEALEVVDQLAGDWPGLAEELYGERVCLLALCGRGEQAIQEVAARSADEWNAAEEVSYALASTGQLDLAIEVLEPGFRNGDHQEAMALHLAQLGRIDEALAILPRTTEKHWYLPPALRPNFQMR